jgi:hypothetical protein
MTTSLSKQMAFLTGVGTVILFVFVMFASTLPGGELMLLGAGTQVIFIVIGIGFTIVLWLYERIRRAGNKSTAGTDTTAKANLSPEALCEDAEKAVDEAHTARNSGNLDVASSQYTEAINVYNFALDEITSSEDQKRVETAIEQAKKDRDAVQTLKQERSKLHTTLQAAEENFQTAVVAHVSGENTLSRVRFRQARDQFETALQEFDTGEIDVFDTVITVPVTTGRDFSEAQLSAIPTIRSDAVEALAAVEIETVAELRQQASDAEDGGNQEIAAVDELQAAGSIDPDVASTLSILSWSNGSDTQTFADRTSITHRREQAAIGFTASQRNT